MTSLFPFVSFLLFFLLIGFSVFLFAFSFLLPEIEASSAFMYILILLALQDFYRDSMRAQAGVIHVHDLPKHRTPYIFMVIKYTNRAIVLLRALKPITRAAQPSLPT